VRIAYVAYAPLSRQGAAPVHVGAVVGGLARLGHSVTILAPEFAKPFELEGVDIRFLSARPCKAPVWAKKAGNWIAERRDELDAVYVRDFYNGNAVLTAAKRANLPVVLEVNGLVRDECKALAGRLDWGYFLKRRIRMADAVIAVSPYLVDVIKQFDEDGEKFHFLPNGVDISLFDNLPDKSAVREELELPANSPIIGNVGSILPYHLGSPIIDVVGLLADEFPDIACLIVGGGPSESDFRAMVAESPHAGRFIITGEVPNERSVRFIRALDVAVTWTNPRASESCWPVRLSSFACAGTPIVAPDWGVYNIFAERGAVLPAKGGTAQSTAEAIGQLLRDEALRQKISRAGIDLAREEFSWISIVSETNEILSKVIKKNRS